MLNKEEDIPAYTIKTVDDPKSLNKIIYIKTSQEQSVNERNGRLVGEKGRQVAWEDSHLRRTSAQNPKAFKAYK